MLGGGKKLAIGLDVGSYTVKAVALAPNKGRLVLQGFAQMRIGEMEQADVIHQVLEHLGVKTRNLITAVSGRSVIVRQVETPKLDDNELRSHMTYEADKYIPFSADEVVMDCHRLPERPDATDDNMDVMLVAARKGFIEDFVQTLHSVGAHPSVVDVDIFALVNAFWTLGPAAAIDAETIALVDIGASKSWVAIVKGDRLLFQREIYLAGNEITDAIVRTFNESTEDVEEIKLNPGDALEALLDAAMPALEDLANEIRLSFDYVEGQFDQEVERVVLTGGSSQLANLPDMLGNILGRPVTVFDPLSGIDLITSKYDLHSLEANTPALTVALGLACHAAASEDIRGLGGMQVAAWQSRRGGGRPTGGDMDHGSSSGAAAPAAAAAAAAPAPEPTPASAAYTPAAPPLDMPSAPPPAPMAPAEPPPAAMAPPEHTPPPAPMTAPEPPPAEAIYDSPPSEEVESVSDVYSREPSAMLVVLDDDTDTGLPSGQGFSEPDVTSLPPEDDDEEQSGGLPPLPG